MSKTIFDKKVKMRHQMMTHGNEVSHMENHKNKSRLRVLKLFVGKYGSRCDGVVIYLLVSALDSLLMN